MLVGRYINPLTDFGFKKLFGEEPRKKFLIDFLNSFLPEHHAIQDLTYTKVEKLGQGPGDRNVFFDLACIGQDGTRFIVEVQKAKQVYYKDRSLFYSTFPIQDQNKKGDWDYKLNPVYSISLLEFSLDKSMKSTNELTYVHLKDDQNNIFTDKLTFIYIELDKFTKSLDELTSARDKWLYILSNIAALDEKPTKLKERIFESFFTEAQIANYTPEERAEYNHIAKKHNDYRNVIHTAHLDGHTKGHTAGQTEGRKQLVLAMTRNGLTPQEIADITNIEVKEILDLL